MTHRLPRLPELTTQRMIAALALLIVGYFVLVGVSLFAFFSLYLTFVIVTILVVRSVPVQPGDWLAVRSVRRTVVAVIVLLLAFLAISPYGPDSVGEVPIVLLLLGFGFVILGRATQRVASAPDALVDERQETLRNRSHRIAYLIFAFLVCATVLGGYTLGSATRSWLGQALRGAPLYTFFLLLFFLPAMVLAWLEPDRLTAADAPKLAPTTRSKIAVAMVALALLTPIVSSFALLLGPVRTTAAISPQSNSEPGTRCAYFEATTEVGVGFRAAIPLRAVACWDGKQASELWGLNASDCHPYRSEETTVDTVQCTRATGPDGTLRFVYHARARSAILPFLTRDAVMRLTLDRDGRVVTFP